MQVILYVWNNTPNQVHLRERYSPPNHVLLIFHMNMSYPCRQISLCLQRVVHPIFEMDVSSPYRSHLESRFYECALSDKRKSLHRYCRSPRTEQSGLDPGQSVFFERLEQLGPNLLAD